ncbi:hypothetical protein Gotur_007233 [Gossypium turneri]
MSFVTSQSLKLKQERCWKDYS